MHTPWYGNDGAIVEPSTIHPLDPVIIILGTVDLFLEATRGSLRLWNGMLMAQANTVFAKEIFAEEASREIETLLSMEEDD